MFFKTLRDLARPQVVAIVDLLKRSEGLAVGDLADALDMSYMGVKQYCIELEKRGYLDTWRRAKETGRPELTYRLTSKAQVLFPQYSNELSLEILVAVRQLHGPTAAEKILYQYFLKKTESYAKRLKGKSLIERATSLAKLRDHEGHCAQVDYDPGHGLRLTEYHSPLADLVKAYPSVARMEEAMLSRLLQAPIQREMSAVSGLMRITFLVAGATQPPPAAPKAGARSRPTAKAKPPEEAKPAESMPDQEQPATVFSVAAEPEDSLEGVSAVQSMPVTEPVHAPEETPLPELIDQAPQGLGDDGSVSALAPAEEEAAANAPAAAEATAAPDFQLNEEPLLFATPSVPAPRLPNRPLSPPRPAAKPAAPVVEELFLSL